ncbi:cytochrome b/b6 domain-containing protein [Nitrosophilus labii]|uniref:cytochrome b/b6 domain-containing protein n=1 Tax=Nitrosophilus labii TaxID=2706014 RepID=UPI001657231F|nr:cytochrome b/b6 domain-containing protein [Nitrosophilus labii]
MKTSRESYVRIKRMTPFMRVNHWVVAISMIGAIATGLYIGHPYYQTFIAEPAVDKYVMAWNRWIHFILAIIFDVSSIVLVYLYFFSRFEKPYKKLIPNSENIKEFIEVFINLLTFNRVKRFDSSHVDSFHVVYFTIFHLLLAWMLLTGLQLYVHGLASGQSSIGSWWPWVLHLATDWTIAVTGGTLMDVRISHHITMYIIIVWIMFHIYYIVWRTIFWREGDISIVFGGYKFKRKRAA